MQEKSRGCSYFTRFLQRDRPKSSVKSNHSSITQLHISLLLPSRFYPSSVTSGWGEKPSPEQNKARNGEITESLSEWPARLKPSAHPLSREELNLLHDPSSPRGPRPFGLDGFLIKTKGRWHFRVNAPTILNNLLLTNKKNIQMQPMTLMKDPFILMGESGGLDWI